ncbi:DUF4097 family beta strand repeat-containing protein [Micromonospora okii]|uniref:DUF4097 family beta strand repeat-containing protein n=1 Tax=Micromonospora okii TaxID=1182970 RepID=UPI001E4905C1|nr:DUF4097 family beta strand repeat-containing protein [Micromonospora okii]
MPTFDTPEPIRATIEITVGAARITATDRGRTVVEVRPTDAAAEADVRAAEQTRVEYADGHLLVRAPRQKVLNLFGRPGSVDVTVELPTGSRVRGEAAAGGFHCAGRLGECRLRTSAGDIRAEHTGPLDLTTSAGSVEVTRVDGRAEVSTGSGRVRLAEVDGPAVVKNSNGETWIGSVTGDARVNAANGDIAIDRARAGVTAATANGGVRVGEVVAGPVSVETSLGRIEVGIHGDTAAWLDLHTQFGTVHNQLDQAAAPAEHERTVEVRARVSYGDIVIRRS